MKNTLKYLSLIVFALIISCVPDKGDTDYLNNRTPYMYFPDDSANFFVKENDANIYEVVVSLSTPQSSSLTYDIAVDPNSEAVEGVDFIITSSSYVVNSGSIVGTFAIQADFDAASTAGKKVNFILSSTEDVQLGVITEFELNLIKLCPINAPFTGMYTITHVGGGIGAAGFAPVFGNGTVVELINGGNDTERLFDVKYYPTFNFANPPAETSISLVCGEVIMNGNNEASGVGCGGSIAIGPGETNATYDPDDDTTFDVIFTEDIDNNCGDSAQTTVTFTKM